MAGRTRTRISEWADTLSREAGHKPRTHTELSCEPMANVGERNEELSPIHHSKRLAINVTQEVRALSSEPLRH